MDSSLVMRVLDDAIDRFGTPEIFNTDQGSQYTSYVHTQKLKDHGVIISKLLIYSNVYLTFKEEYKIDPASFK